MQKFVMLVGVVVLLLAVCGANTEDNLNHQAHINPQSPPLDLPQVPEFSPFSTPVSIPPSLFNSFPPSSLRSSDGSRRDVDVNQPPLSSSSVPDSSSSSLKKKEKKSSKKRQDRGSRPQLVDTRVIPLEATIASEQYGYLLNTFEFDQDVYVNQGFLCAGQDEECNPPPCVACDWSGPEVFFFFFFSFSFSFSFFSISPLTFSPSQLIAPTPTVVAPLNFLPFLLIIILMIGVIALSPPTPDWSWVLSLRPLF